MAADTVPTPPPTAGQLLMPALRWDGQQYRSEAGDVDELLALEVAGFILFGGTAPAASAITAELSARAGRPLLFGSDLERGGGQQFEGLPGLPPLAALAAIEDPDLRREAIRTAARETARAARAVGVGLVFAPVADLANEPDNPIVGTRSPGVDPRRVAEVVELWVAACLAEGVACSVKHWPGHGRTRTDSHEGLPIVEATAEELADDRAPFMAGIAAGAPTVMTAHVAFPALDPSGRAATRSAPILRELRDCGFGGVIVTDALIMEGVGELEAAVGEAVEAGVDLMLYPADALAAARAIAAADPLRVSESAARTAALVARWAEPTSPPHPPARAAAAALCDAVLRPATGSPVRASWVRIRVFDDDLGGRYDPPSREVLGQALLELGVPVGDADSQVESERAECLAILAVFAEPRAWKGRAGLSRDTSEGLREAVGAAYRRGEQVRVVCFGGERILADVRTALSGSEDETEVPVLLAWGGEAPMQRAVARRIARTLRPGTDA